MQRQSNLIVAIAAACGAGIAIVLLYPGQYPYDAANQLWQARTGHLGDGSPVTMAALWSLLLWLTGNPAALFLVNVVLFWAGLALCAASFDVPPVLRIAPLIVIGLSPLALLQMGHVLTDAHFAAAMMLAIGFAARGLVGGKGTALVACTAAVAFASTAAWSSGRSPRGRRSCSGISPQSRLCTTRCCCLRSPTATD